MIIEKPKDSNIKLFNENDGFLTPKNDTQLVVYYSKQIDGDILEIGCNIGRTTVELAKHNPLKKIIGIDYSESKNLMVSQQKGECPGKNLGRLAKNMENVEIINIKSEDFNYENYPNIRFIFIDGDHSYSGVKKDSEKAIPHIKKYGGIILWHDYHDTTEWCGVKKYIDELISNNENIKIIKDSWLAIMIVNKTEDT